MSVLLWVDGVRCVYTLHRRTHACRCLTSPLSRLCGTSACRACTTHQTNRTNRTHRTKRVLQATSLHRPQPASQTTRRGHLAAPPQLAPHKTKKIVTTAPNHWHPSRHHGNMTRAVDRPSCMKGSDHHHHHHYHLNSAGHCTSRLESHTTLGLWFRRGRAAVDVLVDIVSPATLPPLKY